MRTKILIMGLICLFIFAYCKKGVENPHSPIIDPPTIVLNPPTIVSFTSANPDKNRFITISWEVENSTRVVLQHSKPPYVRDVNPTGSVEEEVYGDTLEDAVKMNYSLIAYNDDENVREDIVVESAAAALEITTIPPVPVFIYVVDPEFPNDQSKSYWTSSFTVVLTETYGVGGKVRIELYKPYDGPGTPGFGEMRAFEPYGILTSSKSIRLYRPASYQPPSELIIRAQISDTNGFWTEPFVKIFLGGK